MNGDREESAGAGLAALIEQDPQVLEDGLVLHRTADMPARNVAAVFFGTDASGLSTAVVLFADPPRGPAIEDVLTGLDWPAAETDAGLGGGKPVGRRRVILLARDFYEGFARALARATDKQTRVEASRAWYRSLPGGEHALTVQPLPGEGAHGLRLGAVTDGARSALRFLTAPRKAPGWLDRVQRKLRRSPHARGISSKAAAYLVLACMMATYALVFGYLSLHRHATFNTLAYDLGIFDQGLWLLSTGHYAFVTIRGFHILGDHASLMLVLLAPLYKVWSDVRLILILQTVALALGALPLYWIARKKSESKWVALIFPFAYLMYPALQWTNWDEFHPEALATPLLFLAFYFLMRKKWVPVFVCAALVLITKEAAALAVAALGIYAFFKYDRKRGAALALLSIAWFFVAVAILKAYNGVGVQRVGDLYGPLGGTLPAVALSLLTRPWLVVSRLATPDRLMYLWQLMAPVALLPLLSPSILAVLVPVLASNLLAVSYQYSIHWHYTALMTPFIFIALVYSFAKLKPASYIRYAAVAALVLASVQANAAWSPSPLSVNMPSWGGYTARTVIYNEAVARVPEGASVSAYYAFVPHLDHRQYCYLWPVPFVSEYWGVDDGSTPLPDPKTVQYVLLDNKLMDPVNLTRETSLTASGQFAPVFEREGVVLLKRR